MLTAVLSAVAAARSLAEPMYCRPPPRACTVYVPTPTPRCSVWFQLQLEPRDHHAGREGRHAYVWYRVHPHDLGTEGRGFLPPGELESTRHVFVPARFQRAQLWLSGMYAQKQLYWRQCLFCLFTETHTHQHGVNSITCPAKDTKARAPRKPVFVFLLLAYAVPTTDLTMRVFRVTFFG